MPIIPTQGPSTSKNTLQELVQKKMSVSPTSLTPADVQALIRREQELIDAQE